MSVRIPNYLTLSRLLVIPFFLLNFLYNSVEARYIFLALFTYASITDFLDGYLARTYNVSSNFGRVFDPIADKSLILVTCIIILLRDITIAYLIVVPIIIILLRELVISGIREGLAMQKITIPVSKLAKYKTTIQMIAVGFLIIGGTESVFYEICRITGVIILFLAMSISLITGIQYINATYKDLSINPR